MYVYKSLIDTFFLNEIELPEINAFGGFLYHVYSVNWQINLTQPLRIPELCSS